MLPHMRALSALVLWIAVSVPGSASPAMAGPWIQAAQAHGVDWRLMYAIALQESGMDVEGEWAPWPWTVNSPKGPRRFKSYAEMVGYLRHLVLEVQIENVDVGWGQVNIRWQGHRTGWDVALLADPVANAWVATQVLVDELARTGDLERAVGRYHNPDPERGGAYARRVMRIYKRLQSDYP